jgi:hypothetical protein
MCTKGAGTCLCGGCKAYFCRKHFNDHHAILLNELDGYVEECNILQDQINKTDPHNIILLQIDEWQCAMIDKVKQVAEQARQQIKVPSPKRAEFKTRFKEFSNKIGLLKETEDFVEDDLLRLKEMIHTLKQDLKELDESPSIELYVEQNEQIAWNRLIYIKEKSTAVKNKPEQQQATGELVNKFICRNIHNFIFYHKEKNFGVSLQCRSSSVSRII